MSKGCRRRKRVPRRLCCDDACRTTNDVGRLCQDVPKSKEPSSSGTSCDRNWCRRCPFRAPSGRCLDPTLRSGRCGDWVYYLLPGGKQWRRRWVRPKDPRTPAQLQNRARLGAASHHYGARLTEEERTACTAAGAKRQSRPRLGQSGPLTGQQYSVRQAYAKPAAANARNARIPAQVPPPQKLTRPTWGQHRSGSSAAPGQQGRRQGVTGGRRKAGAASEVLQKRRIMRPAWERYRDGPGVARVRHPGGTGPARAVRARVKQRRRVRLIPARRPAARPCAARVRAPSG